ncbi:MAG: hypothetical protein ABS896_04570 [Carnobacterium inhibens]|uniref:hypothetical protein n=1 Tax=Carnobacterium inhibens TaxID=147709 RepID=UPI003315B1D0
MIKLTFKEFEEYLDANLGSKRIFFEKAMDDQIRRNARRQPAKRWNEAKLERAVDRMWTDMARSIYDKFKITIKAKSSDPYQEWVDFFEKNDAIENLDEMMTDLEFE